MGPEGSSRHGAPGRGMVSFVLSLDESGGQVVGCAVAHC